MCLLKSNTEAIYICSTSLQSSSPKGDWIGQVVFNFICKSFLFISNFQPVPQTRSTGLHNLGTLFFRSTALNIASPDDATHYGRLWCFETMPQAPLGSRTLPCLMIKRLHGNCRAFSNRMCTVLHQTLWSSSQRWHTREERAKSTAQTSPHCSVYSVSGSQQQSHNQTKKVQSLSLSLRLSTKDWLLSPANKHGLTAKVLQHFDIQQSVHCSVAVAFPPCLMLTAATQPFSRQRGKHLHPLHAWYCQSP